MSKPDNNHLQCLGALGRVIQDIRRRLKSGGPAVNYAALHAFIADVLVEDESRLVAEQIAEWQPWHDAYWEIRAAIDPAALEEEPVSQEPLPVGIEETDVAAMGPKVLPFPTLMAPVAKELCGQAAAGQRSQTITDPGRTWQAEITLVNGRPRLTISIRERDLPRPWALAWYRLVDGQGEVLAQCFVVIHGLAGKSGIGEIDLEAVSPGLKNEWDHGTHRIDIMSEISELKQHLETLRQSLSAYERMPTSQDARDRDVIEEMLNRLHLSDS